MHYILLKVLDNDTIFFIFKFFSDAREEEELTNTLTQRAAVLNMLNSANHERDRFLPVTAGAHLGGINAATMGLTGSASDYMRLAMPVRDPDNGDNSISGSGKYFYSFINIKIFHSELAM